MEDILKIPRIIHQTWKNEDILSPFDQLSQTWKEFLPDWEYILWTDEMNREFVCEHFPEFTEKYDAYPCNIQRADAIRYLLLKVYGGLYVDMDFECLENIEFLLKGADFIAGKEPDWHAKRFGLKHIICNAFMASTPNNDFINFVTERLINYPGGRVVNNGFDILNSTGPFLLTHAYDAFPQEENVRILESKTIYPIVQGEVDRIKNNQISKEMEERINQAHAIHYFYGTWFGK
ncbi:glycosyltransferase family 32 protein [Bacteroides sp.]|uniref:glycosyltransferase family 32 protein n=1 Tax=Bacteroides sp. TaxID=29523 RepID=UPI002633F92B|nr:glycosyltransferase [Bacteroides sp.]MDD3038885.1 glycosyltransferase [Bacteroides sp.]